jgi:hypothetical protein
MNQILTKHMGGNKSGALLLTILVLTTGAATKGLPISGGGVCRHPIKQPPSSDTSATNPQFLTTFAKLELDSLKTSI